MIDDIAAFIGGSRWFGGKGRTFSVARVERVATLPGSSPRVVVDLVTLAYDDGERATYQLPLALYPEPVGRLQHALVGVWDDTGDPEGGPDGGSGEAHAEVHAYDAVHDRAAMARFLQLFDEAAGAPDPVIVDDLAFHRLPGYDLDLSVHSTAFSGEQSNSSVMFGEDSLLKLFRKVTPGRNPDIAVHDVLTRAGSEHVPALYGWLSAGDYDLGMLQQFLRTAADGWELALASVRNLYQEADLHPDEVGGDFAAESGRLGAALADVHRTLAEHFPTRRRSHKQMRALAAGMNARLDQAIEIVPQLAEHEAALRASYDDLAHHPGDVAQQVHGDLHLGQTLRTVLGWKIVDFEGEPAKPLVERQEPDSVWRDVAGMLRSFDYAQAVVARTAVETDADGRGQRAFRGLEWCARNRKAFLKAYAGRKLTDAERALLAAYLADKAVYEAVYEIRNRPAWVTIPLSAIARGGAA